MKVRIVKSILWFIVGAAAVVAVARFACGLGPSTGLPAGAEGQVVRRGPRGQRDGGVGPERLVSLSFCSEPTSGEGGRAGRVDLGERVGLDQVVVGGILQPLAAVDGDGGLAVSAGHWT